MDRASVVSNVRSSPVENLYGISECGVVVVGAGGGGRRRTDENDDRLLGNSIQFENNNINNQLG